jgi:uncharacterized YigZ family protein
MTDGRLQYRTVRRFATAEWTDKKSRFLACAAPVSDERQAVAVVHDIRKRHPDATHHCYAYLIDDRIQKQADDGEPPGTAGKPILEVLKSHRLYNTVIVVSRYFGGTMLGTGGLIRAYGEAALLALRQADPVERKLHLPLSVEIDYHWLGILEHECRVGGIRRGDTTFAERVTLCLLPLAAEADILRNAVADWTQGQAVIAAGDPYYIEHEID